MKQRKGRYQTNTMRLVKKFPGTPDTTSRPIKPTQPMTIRDCRKKKIALVLFTPKTQHQERLLVSRRPANGSGRPERPSPREQNWSGNSNKHLLPQSDVGWGDERCPPIQSVKSTHFKLSASQVRSWVSLKHTTRMKGKQIQNQTQTPYKINHAEEETPREIDIKLKKKKKEKKRNNPAQNTQFFYYMDHENA